MDTDAAAAAAAQQLPIDTHAPISKLQSSAVLGANLLNAARTDHRYSSRTLVPRKLSNGQLSRVGVYTEPRRLDLARPRENVWDIPESPEKGPFTLHEKVNRVPLRIRKRKQKTVPTEILSSSSQQQQHVEHGGEQASHFEALDYGLNNGLPIQLSPPRLVLNSDNTFGKNVQIQANLPNGAPRCAVAFYRSDKPAGPRHEQCHNAGTNRTSSGARCTLHLQQASSIRCEHMVDHNGDAVQCRTAGVRGTNRCVKHARLDSIHESAQKRKTEDRHDANSIHPKYPRFKLAKSKTEVHVPTRRTTNPNDTNQGSTTKMSHVDLQQDTVESVEVTAPVSPEQDDCTQLTGTQDFDSRDGRVDNGNVQEVSAVQESGQENYTPKALRRVFKFLQLANRSGRCQTTLCLNLKSDCDKTSTLFSKHDLNVEDIAQNTRRIQAALCRFREVEREDHCAIKEDMYGHVFRSLTRLLRSLYSCLIAEDGKLTKSLEAMRVLSQFVHEMLAVKDTIASWKVSVPRHYSGDKIIKDVNSHLIVPLRDVELVFSKQLNQLERRERNNKELTKVKHQHAEQAEEEARRRRASEEERARWVRWQRLHITRLDCEPDPHRRREHLFITRLGSVQEKDANGVMFERVPLFKNRNTMPQNWSPSIAIVKPWSTVQETALIDGLKHLKGTLICIAQRLLCS
jgi:hypothetical protein